MTDDKMIIEQVSAQYKLYRDEVRGYLGFAAGSASLFVVLVVGEISIAKDNPKLLILIPLSTLSYGAILALFYSYAITAARYSELLEGRLNDLLSSSVFLFETRYVGPKPGQGEFVAFGAIWCCIGAMPCIVSTYAIGRLLSENLLSRGLVISALVGVLCGFAAIVSAVIRIIKVRIRLSAKIHRDWQQGEDRLDSTRE